jgi:hypothetical protein
LKRQTLAAGAEAATRPSKRRGQGPQNSSPHVKFGGQPQEAGGGGRHQLLQYFVGHRFVESTTVAERSTQRSFDTHSSFRVAKSGCPVRARFGAGVYESDVYFTLRATSTAKSVTEPLVTPKGPISRLKNTDALNETQDRRL